MKCLSCSASPLRTSPQLEGLSYCPACSNFFYRGPRVRMPLEGVLRALVEVSGFPDVLDGERAAHITAMLTGRDDPAVEALLSLAAAGVRMRESLTEEGPASLEERKKALTEQIVTKVRISEETAVRLTEGFVRALMLRSGKTEREK